MVPSQARSRAPLAGARRVCDPGPCVEWCPRKLGHRPTSLALGGSATQVPVLNGALASSVTAPPHLNPIWRDISDSWGATWPPVRGKLRWCDAVLREQGRDRAAPGLDHRRV